MTRLALHVLSIEGSAGTVLERNLLLGHKELQWS
jgi:hypothetical protein